jgi:hypothetical protein
VTACLDPDHRWLLVILQNSRLTATPDSSAIKAYNAELTCIVEDSLAELTCKGMSPHLSGSAHVVIERM